MFGRLVKNAAQHTMNLEKASISNLNKALGSLEDSSLGGLGAERIFRGEGLEEGSAAFNLHTVLKEGASKGQYYDEATMQGIVRNIDAGDDAFLGVTPGAMSGSAFLNNIAGQGGAGGQAMAMLGLGVMAGGANTMMGGDFSEGAVVGALGGATVAGVARGLAKSGTNLTDDVLKKAVGDDFLKAGDRKVLQKEVQEELIPGTRVLESGDKVEFDLLTIKGEKTIEPKDAIITEAHARAANRPIEELQAVQMGENFYKTDPKTGEYLLDAQGEKIFDRFEPHRVGLFTKEGSRVEVPRQQAQLAAPKQLELSDQLSAGEARKANLDTFRNLNEEQLKRANLTSAEREAMLETNPTNKGNVAMRNRMLTLGGGMLSGVAFTSNKRDYRRGFNKRRGNRI